MPSCTGALFLALRAAGISPGDEVIVGSYNFPSVAAVLLSMNACPRLVDVRLGSGNLDPASLVDAISSGTKAVVFTHYAGNDEGIDEVSGICAERNLVLIEDAAHALGIIGKYGPIGSHGQFAAYSFHESKNVQCGEGGSLRVNDETFLERIEIMREKGTNRTAFRSGLVDKYKWVDEGNSWLIPDVTAAILLSNLLEFETIQSRRQAVWRAYSEGLSEWALDHNFLLLDLESSASRAAHLFPLIGPNVDAAKRLQAHLISEGVMAHFHYQPLSTAPATKFLDPQGLFPRSEALGSSLLRLPLYPSMSPEEVNHVIRGVMTARVEKEV
jgi:dTDP-4-amino-4,6-dideoxygalactose transaminase